MVAESGDPGGSRVPPPAGGRRRVASSGGTRRTQPLPSSMAATLEAECDWARVELQRGGQPPTTEARLAWLGLGLRLGLGLGLGLAPPWPGLSWPGLWPCLAWPGLAWPEPGLAGLAGRAAAQASTPSGVRQPGTQPGSRVGTRVGTRQVGSPSLRRAGRAARWAALGCSSPTRTRRLPLHWPALHDRRSSTGRAVSWKCASWVSRCRRPRSTAGPPRASYWGW